MRTGQATFCSPWSAVARLAVLFILTSVAHRSVVAHDTPILVMFEQDHCAYCEQWHSEIGPVYGKTPEGARAPLRLVNLHGALPSDLPGLKPAQFSPVFVLWHEGREVGRILGYPGEDFFWPMLGELLAQTEPVDESGL